MTLKSFFIRLMMMRELNGSGLLPEITHVPLLGDNKAHQITGSRNLHSSFVVHAGGHWWWMVVEIN